MKAAIEGEASFLSLRNDNAKNNNITGAHFSTPAMTAPTLSQDLLGPWDLIMKQGYKMELNADDTSKFHRTNKETLHEDEIPIRADHEGRSFYVDVIAATNPEQATCLVSTVRYSKSTCSKVLEE